MALAGCGTATSGGNSTVAVSGKTLRIYASQPPGPPTPAVSDTLKAEQLAVTQADSKASSYTVKLVSVHDRELSADARAAVEDGTTIAYLGELVAGTSQVSVEILNQQGILEVSPADTAAYLTQSVSAVSGSPTTFYPGHSTYKETFGRVVPTTIREAQALVGAMQAEHASSVYVENDGSQYGRTIAQELQQSAKSAGLSVAASPASAQAVFYGGNVQSPASRAAAVHAIDQAAASAPSAHLYVPSGLYDPAFVTELSSAAQGRLFASSPGFLSRDLPTAGKRFMSAFKTAYGHAPAPQAIFGYEAMSAVLATLSQAGADANQRATVVKDFRSLKRPNSVLGSYIISGGDPSVAPFILARVRSGQLVPFKFLSVSG